MVSSEKRIGWQPTVLAVPQRVKGEFKSKNFPQKSVKPTIEITVFNQHFVCCCTFKTLWSRAEKTHKADAAAGVSISVFRGAYRPLALFVFKLQTGIYWSSRNPISSDKKIIIKLLRNKL
jgi:hypothetical protein